MGVEAGVGAGVVVRYVFQAFRFAASASKAAFLPGGILVFGGARTVTPPTVPGFEAAALLAVFPWPA